MVFPTYSVNIETLLRGQPLMPLDAGVPDSSAAEQLDSALLERLFGSKIITNKTSARLCVAGLWLLYNHLEECHKIAQSTETPDGNYWHAIMHRREGDFSNSKYWYRRVGEHEIFPELLKQSQQLVAQDKQMNAFLNEDRWNPVAFVGLCEEAIQGRASVEFCQNVQQVEWRLLFDHCYRKAVST